MAEINAGEVTVGAGTYEVILRRVGGSNSNTGGTGANASTGEESFTVGGKRKGSRKTRKAGKTMEGGKKRKMSGYMKFAASRRANIISEHPEWKGDVVAVAKEIGKQWRGMSDAEKAKY